VSRIAFLKSVCIRANPCMVAVYSVAILQSSPSKNRLSRTRTMAKSGRYSAVVSSEMEMFEL